jgi:hypothetical protein
MSTTLTTTHAVLKCKECDTRTNIDLRDVVAGQLLACVRCEFLYEILSIEPFATQALCYPEMYPAPGWMSSDYFYTKDCPACGFWQMWGMRSAGTEIGDSIECSYCRSELVITSVSPFEVEDIDDDDNDDDEEEDFDDDHCLRKLREYYTVHKMLPRRYNMQDCVGLRTGLATTEMVRRMRKAEILKLNPGYGYEPGKYFFEQKTPVPAPAAQPGPVPLTPGPVPVPRAVRNHPPDISKITEYLVSNPSRTVLLTLKDDSIMIAGLM